MNVSLILVGESVHMRVSFGSDPSQQSWIQNVRISIHSVIMILDSPLTPRMYVHIRVQDKLKNDQWNRRKSWNLCF
ncbi:hypothetical protein YC2023_016543 [Brassica napus]